MKKLNQIIDAVGMMFIGFMFASIIVGSVFVRHPVIMTIIDAERQHIERKFAVICRSVNDQRIICSIDGPRPSIGMGDHHAY